MNKIRNVLVIDDDPDIGMMLQMMLEYKNYGVTLLNKAAETEAVLSKKSIDVIILDMLIAGVNGTDVCRVIKQNKQYAHIPILMISALPDAGKICIEAGADGFISKPFEMHDLLAKVISLTETISEKH